MDRLAYANAIEIVSALIENDGYECLEIEWDDSDDTLRVFIDAESGITMEDCLRVNSILIECSELDKLFGDDYRLEVSSPGVDRPLRTIDHFVKSVGQKVSIDLSFAVGGRSRGSGSLIDISSDNLLTIESAQGPWIVPFAAISKARIEYDW